MWQERKLKSIEYKAREALGVAAFALFVACNAAPDPDSRQFFPQPVLSEILSDTCAPRLVPSVIPGILDIHQSDREVSRDTIDNNIVLVISGERDGKRYYFNSEIQQRKIGITKLQNGNIRYDYIFNNQESPGGVKPDGRVTFLAQEEENSLKLKLARFELPGFANPLISLTFSWGLKFGGREVVFLDDSQRAYSLYTENLPKPQIESERQLGYFSPIYPGVRQVILFSEYGKRPLVLSADRGVVGASKEDRSVVWLASQIPDQKKLQEKTGSRNFTEQVYLYTDPFAFPTYTLNQAQCFIGNGNVQDTDSEK